MPCLEAWEANENKKYRLVLIEPMENMKFLQQIKRLKKQDFEMEII